MIYLLKNIVCPVSEKPNFVRLVKQKFGFSIDDFEIKKQAIDARKRNKLNFVYTITVESSKKLKPHPDIVPYTQPIPLKISNPNNLQEETIFIIGMGPAGLFAALKLVEYGYKPALFDRGSRLEERQQIVSRYFDKIDFDPDTNVQFGEGGAGTFSDGKLTARTHNIYTDDVYKTFIRFGANPQISIQNLPHLGTDNIIQITKNIRSHLIEKGCTFNYNAKLTDISIESGEVKNVTINGEKHLPNILILATGNSARDIFTLCSERKVPIVNKPFAVGLRIEHTREYINSTFYGENNDFNITGPATYKLTANHQNRSIYSFCMCPGGFVIPSASDVGGHTINGMSYSQRDGQFSNSAIVVAVNEADYGSNLLDGLRWQQHLEKSCFKPFSAPAQNVSDYKKSKTSTHIKPNSYCHDIRSADLTKSLPSYIVDSISYALKIWDQKYTGFIENGLFIGIETRTSSSVRIIRDEYTLASPVASNLYTIGEGSGYAGGIISSASDAVRIAHRLGDRR
jgi:hypothetical protein